MFSLISTSLENLPLKKGFENPEAGAFCSFEGWVRNNNDGKIVSTLEYEAFAELCESLAEEILKDAKTKFGVFQVKCFHRTGKLKVGEMAVWVGVVAGHRDEAFQACRYIIDEIKHRLPIWKKEYYTDGETEWVKGHALCQHRKVNHHETDDTIACGGEIHSHEAR
jgi:adenylyltransferase/sulfurtransferase